jgi:hypothetical protein
VRGLPSLRRRDLTRAIGEELRKGRQKPGFRVVHFSIQANHIHLIVEAAGRRMLWRGMTGVGVRIARAVNRTLGRRGQVVADRYHASADPAEGSQERDHLRDDQLQAPRRRSGSLRSLLERALVRRLDGAATAAGDADACRRAADVAPRHRLATARADLA